MEGRQSVNQSVSQLFSQDKISSLLLLKFQTSK